MLCGPLFFSPHGEPELVVLMNEDIKKGFGSTGASSLSTHPCLYVLV